MSLYHNTTPWHTVNNQYIPTPYSEMKKNWLPRRESNPGRLGENQKS